MVEILFIFVKKLRMPLIIVIHIFPSFLGPETVKICLQQDVINFLMSGYCLLGGANLIIDNNFLSKFFCSERNADTGKISVSFNWDIAVLDTSEVSQLTKLTSWFYLHDEILGLLMKYYMLAQPHEIESVLYILHYAVNSSTKLISLRLTRWLVVYIKQKDQISPDSPVLISILECVFSLLEGYCKDSSNPEEMISSKLFLPSVGTAIFELFQEIMTTFPTTWCQFLASGIDSSYSLNKETLSQMVPTPSGTHSVVRESLTSDASDFQVVYSRSFYLDLIVSLFPDNYLRPAVAETLQTTVQSLLESMSSCGHVHENTSSFQVDSLRERTFSEDRVIGREREVLFSLVRNLAVFTELNFSVVDSQSSSQNDKRAPHHSLSFMIHILSSQNSAHHQKFLQEIFQECLLNEYPEVLFPFTDICSPDAVEILHLQLTLLTAMTKHSDDMKDGIFEKLVDRYLKFTGRDKIANTNISLFILHAEPTTSLATILVLFDMMFDGHPWFVDKIVQAGLLSDLNASESSENDSLLAILALTRFRPRIHNRKLIAVLLSIAAVCRYRLRKFIISMFTVLVDTCAPIVNVTTCLSTDRSLFDMILDQFPSYESDIQVDAAGLLEVLGKHSISVSQLKKLFRMIQSRGKCRPPYTSLLLRTLRAMMIEKREPRQFFILEGAVSGLLLPPIQRWPASKVFSFTTWFKVESQRYDPNQMDDASCLIDSILYTPYILSLRTDKKAGFEVLLAKVTGHADKFRLLIRSYNSSGESSVISPPSLSVVEGKWHFLGISMQGPSGLSQKCEIGVILDDKFVRHPFTFPSFSGSINRPCVGDSCDFQKEPNLITTFKGQIGSVNFFADILSEGQLRGVYALGPNYLYCFEPSSLNCCQAEMTETHMVDPFTSVLSGNLTAKLMFSFNSAGYTASVFHFKILSS